MKVSKLFIIGIGPNPSDQELLGGVDALYFRYTQIKGLGNVQSIVVDTSKGCVVQEREGKTNPEGGNDNVGVYIIGHGAGLVTQRLGGLAAEEAAGFLSSFLAKQGITTLRKACIVSCGLGTMSGSKAFLELFAQTLATTDPAYDPMVAGWDEYISICFPGMTIPCSRNLYQSNGHDAIAPKDYKEYIGRKFVKYKDKYRFLHDEARTAQKHFVWIKKGGEEVKLNLSGWHDQP
jgi:hypothetical protein